uniref:hypoxia-inducible factor-proline dioxygenase n=1 Tax=Parastrongyloides trichosuri TaxID=131310 RepID=A0A0N4ZYJ8_PARTI
MNYNTTVSHQHQYNVQRQAIQNNPIIQSTQQLSQYVSSTLPSSSYTTNILYPNNDNTVLTTLPYAYVPSYMFCSFCKIDLTNLNSGILKCRVCQGAMYCCQEHQTLDWELHKDSCKEISTREEYINNISRLNIVTGTEDDNMLMTTIHPSIIKNYQPPEYPQSQQFIDHSKNFPYTTTLQEHMKNLSSSGISYNQNQVIYSRLCLIAQNILENLQIYGYALVDNFLGNNHSLNIFNEIDILYRKGLFSAGQLMDKKDSTSPEDIRSDQIFWFDSTNKKSIDAVHIRLLIQMVDSVVNKFKDKIPPHSIGGRSPAMIAIYPGNGTKYVKHVDNPTNDVSKDGRCITAIYYCNENWDVKKDGGALRLYPKNCTLPIDIVPKADRLIFFWSDARNPHEVMPVFNRPRIGITIWYFDRRQQMLHNKEKNDKDMTSRKRKSPEVLNNSELSNKRVLMDLTRYQNLFLISPFFSFCMLIVGSEIRYSTRLLRVYSPSVLLTNESSVAEIPNEDPFDTILAPIIYIVIGFIISGAFFGGGVYLVKYIGKVPPKVNREYKEFKSKALNKDAPKMKQASKDKVAVTLPESIIFGLKSALGQNVENKAAVDNKVSAFKNVTKEIADPYNIR